MRHAERRGFSLVALSQQRGAHVAFAFVELSIRHRLALARKWVRDSKHAPEVSR